MVLVAMKMQNVVKELVDRLMQLICIGIFICCYVNIPIQKT